MLQLRGDEIQQEAIVTDSRQGHLFSKKNWMAGWEPKIQLSWFTIYIYREILYMICEYMIQIGAKKLLIDKLNCK